MAEENVASFHGGHYTQQDAERAKNRSAKLAKQDLTTLDVTQLNPLTPEVISRQATINIGTTVCCICCHLIFLGTIGHVAHGKSTAVKAISGVKV